MLTIKAMVKKDGLRVDRKYNVKLCFTYNRKVKRLSTSLFASPEDPVFHNVQIPYVHQLQNVLHEHNENISIHMQIFKI